MITVSGIAKIPNDDRAAMTEQETTLLGQALGSLLEPTVFNTNYGWLIAETGDYQAIGYVLIMYLSPINDIVQDIRRVAGGQQARYSGQASTALPPSQNGAVKNYTPGAFMQMNLNLKSPPGIHPGYGR